MLLLLRGTASRAALVCKWQPGSAVLTAVLSRQPLRGIGVLKQAIDKMQMSANQLTSVHADLCQVSRPDVAGGGVGEDGGSPQGCVLPGSESSGCGRYLWTDAQPLSQDPVERGVLVTHAVFL